MSEDPHKLGFYFEDAPIIDYGLVFDEDLGRFVRPPLPSPEAGDGYFSAIGAAHTFGRYSDDPFPAQLSRRLRLGVVNFGRGGVGPAHFLKSEPVIARINAGRFCVVQVMGGRSTTTSHAHDPDDINRVESRFTNGRASALQTYRPMWERDRDLFWANMRELQSNYLANFRALAEAITVPKVLLLVALEPPLRRLVKSTPLERMWRAPQFVDRTMIDEMKSHAEAYCEVVSRRGLPQPLYYGGRDPVMRNLWEGRPLRQNAYYPSPEVHEEIAAALARTISNAGLW